MRFHLSVVFQTGRDILWRLDFRVTVGVACDRPCYQADNNEGMPRILLSTAHITPFILDSLGVKYTPPSLVATYPPLPKPFHATADRISRLQTVDSAALFEKKTKDCLESAKKPFCSNFAGRPRP